MAFPRRAVGEKRSSIETFPENVFGLNQIFCYNQWSFPYMEMAKAELTKERAVGEKRSSIETFPENVFGLNQIFCYNQWSFPYMEMAKAELTKELPF
ncbi:hypothetical protein Glove_208g144 [Diversispora epigaea]|uniref:Uncharacterized protein n=1 Tax=Diversispora epigaea TaxID=1348612 RepID=A0A397IJ50_9GLOM|nr:hypothetical protein Glove_208g144 [Diversispora epigaea]